MIEDIAAHIDPKLRPVSGKVFYSGRAAWRMIGGVYVLGFNPGGDPATNSAETVRTHTDYVLTQAPCQWSAYSDESWKGRAAGQAPLQRRLQHLLSALGFDPRKVPSSNLIFSRSRRSADLGMASETLVDLCWPVHQAVMFNLRPKAIICLGIDTGDRVRKRLGATQAIGAFREQNDRGWISFAWKSSAGLMVFSLTHPSIADWTTPQCDPSKMVKDLLSDAVSQR